MTSTVLSSVTLGDDDGAEVWILHGILGSGRNWRSFVRRVQASRPDLRFRLIDLRHHGESQGAFDGPDTIASCVQDLEVLARACGRAPVAVVGHSFGGKVALMHAAECPAGLQQTWVLDARPGPVDVSSTSMEVLEVIGALRTVALPIESHRHLKENLMAMGFSGALSSWMTTNLARREEGPGFGWRFDLDAVESMIRDYAAVDGWPVVCDPPLDLHLVVAGRGDRWSRFDRVRLEEAPARVHELKDSGHWVHVDAPEALARLLTRHLPRVAAQSVPGVGTA